MEQRFFMVRSLGTSPIYIQKCLDGQILTVQKGSDEDYTLNKLKDLDTYMKTFTNPVVIESISVGQFFEVFSNAVNELISKHYFNR